MHCSDLRWRLVIVNSRRSSEPWWAEEEESIEKDHWNSSLHRTYISNRLSRAYEFSTEFRIIVTETEEKRTRKNLISISIGSAQWNVRNSRRNVIVYELLLDVIVVRGRPRDHGKVRGAHVSGESEMNIIHYCPHAVHPVWKASPVKAVTLYRLRGRQQQPFAGRTAAIYH